MGWDVVLTDECRDWYGGLTEAEQDSIIPIIDLLVEQGPTLRYPYSSGVSTSAFASMGFNTPDGPTGFFTRSIRTVRPSYC
jgi:hypothetical protein